MLRNFKIPVDVAGLEFNFQHLFGRVVTDGFDPGRFDVFAAHDSKVKHEAGQETFFSMD